MGTREYIGTAEMDELGIIYLVLHAETPVGLGTSRFSYRPDDPEYADVLAHLGGLKSGEKKSVRPWPEAAAEKRS